MLHYALENGCHCGEKNMRVAEEKGYLGYLKEAKEKEEGRKKHEEGLEKQGMKGKKKKKKKHEGGAEKAKKGKKKGKHRKKEGGQHRS